MSHPRPWPPEPTVREFYGQEADERLSRDLAATDDPEERAELERIRAWVRSGPTAPVVTTAPAAPARTRPAARPRAPRRRQARRTASGDSGDEPAAPTCYFVPAWIPEHGDTAVTVGVGWVSRHMSSYSSGEDFVLLTAQDLPDGGLIEIRVPVSEARELARAIARAAQPLSAEDDAVMRRALWGEP